MSGQNIDASKVEIKVGLNEFLSKTFANFHVAIWSCMLLKDVLELLPWLMPQEFITQFFFIWG
jgi:hypothetical protein